jgi:pimeloyl-ACP methyl ester carboxylesterase
MPLADVADHKLYYELHEAEAPEPALPPLVLVTGMGGRCEGWLPYQVPSLRARRSVLIYDHRGVGQSDDLGAPFTTADLARDLIGLLDSLEIEQVDAAGYFLGGMTIQEAALASPSRFRRLVLIGSWARPDARRGMLLNEWAALARAGISAASMTRQRLIWTFSEEALEHTELIEPAIARLDDGQTPLTGEGFARQCEACASHDSLDRLHDLEHPILAVCGRRDLLTPPKFNRAISERAPNARDVALSYCGHACMIERADRFNEIVAHFLDDPEASH